MVIYVAMMPGIVRQRDRAKHRRGTGRDRCAFVIVISTIVGVVLIAVERGRRDNGVIPAADTMHTETGSRTPVPELEVCTPACLGHASLVVAESFEFVSSGLRPVADDVPHLTRRFGKSRHSDSLGLENAE